MKVKKPILVKDILGQSKLILPQQPNHDEFLQVMNKVFLYSSLFGVMGSRRLSVRVWSTLVLASLLAIVVLAVWKVIKALAGWARDTAGHRSVTARMSGTIFYTIATISLVLGSRLALYWRELSEYWAGVERVTVINVAGDDKLRRRMVIVCCFMTGFCIFEHWISMISLVGLDCPRELILKKYVLKSHGFLILWNDYSDWAAVPLLIVSSIATALWTFQDVLIVLISMGLTSRYRRLNKCVEKISAFEKKQLKWDKKTEALKVYTWRKIREAYVRQSALVRKVDQAIGGMIVLACSCHFYFICLQLFMGITTGKSISIIRRVYFAVSFTWLCIRACSVVLTASSINVQSRSALNYIYDCEPHCYNVEMNRLQDQLVKDYVALSGLGFFYLSRTILLQMAGAIITYELVLIQFDDGENATPDANHTVVFNVTECCQRARSVANMKLNTARTGSTIQTDDFLETFNRVFSIARYIGISNIRADGFFAWTAVVFLSLVAIVVAALWKVVKVLARLANHTTNGRSLVSKLSGSIFYGNGFLSLVFSIRFITAWTNLSYHWYKANTIAGFNLPPDMNIKRRMVVISVFVSTCAVVEHSLSMMSATGLDCPPEEYFQRYILSSHGFLLQPPTMDSHLNISINPTNIKNAKVYEYNLWTAIPIFLASKVATALWNFQDLIIILISMGLTSRYHRLNTFVKQVIKREKRNKDVKKVGTDRYMQIQVWRRVREAYVRQATLVRKVDNQLGALILLSNVNNLYFICLQLFLGIGKISGTFIQRAYYFMSLGWLLFRACIVVLAASDIYSHSTMALPSLYKCPGSSYNVEIKRLINQLTNDDVTLTGMGFFSLNRKLMLQVAAVILKYELVLIQYDIN